jgi:hypothetical protein
MADEDEEEAGPVVELGEGDPVEGAPLARVASRLYYGIEMSEVRRREGGTAIRTPDGPRGLDEILDSVDATYFDTRQAFVNAVEGVVGTGPVPTSDEERDGSGADAETDDEATAPDENAEDADAEDDADE